MAKSKTEIIYGIHAVESVLKNNRENLLQVWVQQGRKDQRIQQLVSLIKQSGVSLESISSDKMKRKCEDAKHQGVIAKIRSSSKSTTELEDILHKDKLLVLVLDAVQDPHNIGACLRTADAAGVDAVIVSHNRSPGLTPVVRKVASGAADTVPFIQVSNLARALQKLRDAGVWIIGTSDDADHSLYECSVESRVALVMGSEGEGMRRLTRESCDELVSIPMLGSVESLNVSVATGITLYEFRRRMQLASNAAGIDGH